MFLYFVPDFDVMNLDPTCEKRFSAEKLPRPLNAVLGDIRALEAEVAVSGVRSGAGPGGASGCIVAPFSKKVGAPKEISYQPGLQVWEKIENANRGERFWIGYNVGQEPSPESLLRNKWVPGYDVTDDSGRKWVVPVLRSPFDKFGTLEQFFEFDDVTGAVVGELKEEQRGIWELGGEIWNWYNADFDAQSGSAKESTAVDGPDAEERQEVKASRPDFTWLTRVALKVLQINYRISGPELRVLRKIAGPVLTQMTVFAITQTAIGFDLIAESTKKKVDPIFLPQNG